jgi:tetratricopeptide (TPR) repeat protein
VSPEWQISAAELFEFIRPAAWTLSALVSSCVLASARRQGLRSYSVAAWTLGTLFFPLIILPLYLIARAILRRRARARKAAAQTASAAQPQTQKRQKRQIAAASQRFRYTLPVLYLIAVVSLIAIFFYRDYRSLDAHLWRANNAKLRGPHSKVIAEYRAALRLEDDPHTRKLLAVELAADGLHEEALAEFRAAERGGEPDRQLPYYLGTALFSLGREAEAASAYKRFLDGPLCTDVLPDLNCSTARARLSTLQPR